MTDDGSPVGTPPEAGSSTVPPSGTPVWRVPETDPRPWARGKTAEELLGLSDQMFQGLQQLASTPPAIQQTPVQSGFQMPGDDDIVDGRTMKAMLAQIAAPQQDPYQQQSLAQLAYGQVRGMEPKVFQKWEPEILRHLNTMDKRMWTVDNINLVVKMVKAEHVEELASERADALIAQKGFSTRTTGAAPNGQGHANGEVSLESDELPTDYRDRLKKAGVSMETVRSYCAANGVSVKSWFEQAKKSSGVMGGANG